MTEIRCMEEEDREALPLQKLLGVSVALYGGKYAIAFPSFGPERRGALSWPLPGLTVRRFTTAAKSENVILLWFWMKPFLVKAFLMI